MLRRADRALLEAKQRGRNMVVQLGSGIYGEAEEPAKRRWWFQRQAGNPDMLVEKWLATPVPMQVAVEKLRGFVVDHFAEIESDRRRPDPSEAGRPADAAAAHAPPTARCRSWSSCGFRRMQAGSNRRRTSSPLRPDLGTHVYVAIRPKTDRDRRRSDAQERARLVMSSIKAYLMATEEPRSGNRRSARGHPLTPWLRKKSCSWLLKQRRFSHGPCCRGRVSSTLCRSTRLATGLGGLPNCLLRASIGHCFHSATAA